MKGVNLVEIKEVVAAMTASLEAVYSVQIPLQPHPHVGSVQALHLTEVAEALISPLSRVSVGLQL